MLYDNQKTSPASLAGGRVPFDRCGGIDLGTRQRLVGKALRIRALGLATGGGVALGCGGHGGLESVLFQKTIWPRLARRLNPS